LRRATLITVVLLGACRSVAIGTLPSDGAALDGAAASERRPAPSSWVVSADPQAHFYASRGDAIGLDATGNVYVAGTFSGTVHLGSRTLTSCCSSWPGIPSSPLVAKLDRQGSVLWAAQGEGIGAVEGLGVDAAGNSHVMGAFHDTIRFGSTQLKSSGDLGLFIARLDPHGNFLWAVSPQAEMLPISRAIAVDRAGNSYVTGAFKGTASFGAITAASPDPTTGASFVAKLSPTGSFLWVTLAPVSSPPTEWPSTPGAIAVDADGSSLVTGRFTTPVTFGSTTLTRKGEEGDLFLAKLDPSGHPVWAISGSAPKSARGTGLTLDGKGHGYLTGAASSSGQSWPPVGSLTLGSRSVTIDTTDDRAFLARFAASDGVFDWIAAPKGTTSPGGAAADGQGQVYLAVGGTDATFGSTTLHSPCGSFIAGADPNGSFTWATAVGAPAPRYDAGTLFCGADVAGLAVDGQGGVLATGKLRGALILAGTTLTAENEGLFVWKLTPP
jgi:hypothetical protein